MSRSLAPRATRPRPTILSLCALVGLTACSMPNFEGPQIQSPPRGFLLVPDSHAQRRMFPEREVRFHAAWVESVQDFSTIYINGHPGALTADDVITAQDRAMRLADDPDLAFGGIEALTIDGRTAWGWPERIESPSRGLVSVAYRALVPYDTISYAIEFESGEPGLKRAAPDTLRAIVSSFAVGQTTWNVPLLALVAGLALFAVHSVRQRQAAAAARLRSINLVTVKKDEEGEEGEEALETASLAARGSDAT